MSEFPRIISVDDHVIEPPNVWTDRLPAKYADVGPRVVRAPMKAVSFVGGNFRPEMGEPGSGEDVDWWLYEELRRPLVRLDAAVGHDRDEIKVQGTTYEWMRPGS